MTLPDAPWLHVGFASLHVLVGHFLSAVVHRLRFGRDPLVVHDAPPSAHRATSRALGALASMWAVSLLAAAFSAQLRESPLLRPLVAPLPGPGWSLAVAGLVLMAAAQLTMGEAFRVGQDPARAPDALCERGLHARSRNPIYLGSFTCLAGMTLWWPAPLLVMACAAIGAGMHRLVLEEERFLLERFGDRYRAYRLRVPRYLGLPGREASP